MQIVCPDCQAVYRISADRLPTEGTAFATCRRCGSRIRIGPAGGRDTRFATSRDEPPPSLKRDLRASPRPESAADFGVGESIGFGWRAFQANRVFLVLVIVIVFVLQTIPQFIGDRFEVNQPILAGLVYLAGWVFSQFLTLGLTAVGLKVCDGRITDYGELFQHGSKLLNFIVASILYGLLCAVGFLLLIVPGVYWALQYQFYGFHIVDRSSGPLEALKQSAELTRGFKWRLLGFWVVLLLINILGLIPLGLGLLITVPLSLMAFAHVFRRLQGRQPRPAWEDV